MGNIQARQFLRTFLQAVSIHDYESVEQLRRVLAIQHYRRVLHAGQRPTEKEIVPDTNLVEKWLLKMREQIGATKAEWTELLEAIDAGT